MGNFVLPFAAAASTASIRLNHPVAARRLDAAASLADAADRSSREQVLLALAILAEQRSAIGKFTNRFWVSGALVLGVGGLVIG